MGQEITLVETKEQAYVLEQLRDVSQLLVKAGRSVIDTVERATRYVEQGSNVNSLGELQGQGPNFDRLCGERQQMARMAKLLGCADEHIVQASRGDSGWFVHDDGTWGETS